MSEIKAPRNTGGAIAKAAAGKAVAKSKRSTMQSYIERMRPEIERGLPKGIEVDRYVRTLLSAISANPKLAECDPASYMASMMTITQMGLEANTQLGQAWIIPYFNNKERRYEAQTQIGVRGYLELLYRSGEVISVQVQEVREGDEFSYQLGLHPDLHHVPARANRGDPTDYYAVINLKGGGFIFEVMSREEIEEHAKKFSKASGAGSPWQSHFSSMAKKTVLKKALKYAPMSASLQRHFAADETIKREIAPDMSEVAGEYIIDDGTGEIVAEVAQDADQQEAQVSIDE